MRVRVSVNIFITGARREMGQNSLKYFYLELCQGGQVRGRIVVRRERSGQTIL